MLTKNDIYKNKLYEKSKDIVVNTYLNNSMKNDRLFEFQEHFSHHINVPCFDLISGNVYVEIGSFYGHSGSVMSSAFENKKIICIDIFNNSYFKSLDLKEDSWTCPPEYYRPIAENNIKKFNKNNELHFIEGKSTDEETLTELNNILGKDKIDLLFIDGDHRYEYVMNDFEKYFPLITSGGLIVFDDYFQKWNKDTVQKAVKDICLKYKSQINVIGVPEDKINIKSEEQKYKLPFSIKKETILTHNSSFIVQKL